MSQGKGNSMISIVLVLILVFSGQVSAKFKQCFETCAIGCALGQENKIKCAGKCFAKCIFNPGMTASGSSKLDYCKFGCAVQHCAAFGKDFDKVDNCVNTCETNMCS